MALILWSIGIMVALGVLFGIGLAVASRFLHVVIDPRVEHATHALPGANCGGCGFPGCEAYATAVVTQGAAPTLCRPGGAETAHAIARIMRLVLDDVPEERRAVVHCQGGCEKSPARFEYTGLSDCRAAQLVQGGPKACEFGCLGFGACVAVCPFGAVTLGPDRIPVIDRDTCTGCGACVSVCPRHLFELLPVRITHYLACANQDQGRDVREVCRVGCTSCWLCLKAAPEDSIEKNGNLPRLLYPAGVDYGAAMAKCPMHCYVRIERAAQPASASA